MNIDLFIYLFILLQSFWVSIVDIKHKKISNHWLFLNISLTIIFTFFFSAEYLFNGQKILYSLAFFAAGFVLYLFKIIGAGDSKYLCSLFLLMPAPWCEIALYSLFATTVIIGGFVFFTTVVKNFDQILFFFSTRDYQNIARVLNNRFSYAPVILVSWILTGILIYGRGYIGH